MAVSYTHLNDCHDMTGEGLKNVFDDFDYIFIDCPPALSKHTYNALVAASKILIPVQMEALSDVYKRQWHR